MTFEEARAELNTLAGGKYRALYYELIEDEKGVVEQTCRAYIDPRISSDPCPTWREALDDIAAKLAPAPSAPVEVSGAPVDDVPMLSCQAEKEFDTTGIF